MSWAPSEAKPTVSTVLVGGEISSPLLGTEDPSWRGAPEEACREGILCLGTIFCPATAGQWEVVEFGSCELSPWLPGAERCLHTDEASVTSAPSRPVREELDAWGRTRVDSETCLSRRKQIHLCLAELPPFQLHHLGVEPPFPGPQPLSRQDVCVCSYIVNPRDVTCSKRQQIPQENLAQQFAKWTWPQTPGYLCTRPLMCWPPMCCLSGRDLLGNSLEQEIQPTSPDGWCAMGDDGQGFFHITKAHKHRLVTLIIPLGKILWSWAITAGVSCTTVQKV